MKINRAKLLRTFRIISAVCLIGVSLWALMLPPLFPYSTHSIVNTKVVTIKGEDLGVVSNLAIARTTLLAVGDRVATVTRNQKKVQRDLEERQFSFLKLTEQIENVDESLLRNQQKLEEAEKAASAARLAAQQLLAQKHAAAVAQIRLYREDFAEREATQQRVVSLYQDGIITSAQWSETRQQTIEAEKNLRSAESELAVLENELAELRRVTNEPQQELQDEFTNSKLFYEREIGNLRLQRTELNVKLTEMGNQIAAAKTYLISDQTYDLVTPISGVVWRRLAVDGENIIEGQSVVQMAAADAIFVEAYFQRQFINGIAIGDHANINLIAEDRFIEGTVADIQVQEDMTAVPNVINSVRLDSSMLKVTIEVSKEELTVANIGQLAKVLVSSAEPGVVERAMIWMSFLLKGPK